MLPRRQCHRELARDILDELAWDVHVAECEVSVEIRNGMVILSGAAPSLAAKLAAEAAAHRVRGVHHVANDLEVRLPDRSSPSDAELAAVVRSALTWDAFVPERLLESSVAMGIVTLRGCVDTYQQRNDGERAVRNLAGVRAIHNEILVLGVDITPDSLRDNIHHALERNVDGEALGIEVEIDSGRVTLHGHVSSWRAREVIVGAVMGTRGVLSVVDHLQLL